ncbi:MAG TPA: hypothetical protein VKF15_08145 [Nitrososphaerales archaeon]|nr:hypothetical protein [Nitrososphaerales archaeon]
MLRYELLQLTIGDTEYVLLPKLVPAQLEILANRLSKTGFHMTEGATLTARRPGQAIRVSPAGLCWSNRDPTDAVAPAIPDLLAVQKRPARGGAVLREYFQAKRAGRSPSLRFHLRVESGPLWTRLRRADACGLAPDEHSVVQTALAAGTGQCTMLTDFPVEGSRVRVLGRKQYYVSSLACSEAASTLRVAGRKEARNSYLPEDGCVSLGSMRNISHRQWIDVLKGLGGWCFWDPF